MNKLKLLSISSLVSLLCGALFAANEPDVIASLEYFYAQDGTLIGRAVNGVRQNFEYDKRGQLLAVKDANGRDLERYTYDPAGNRLSKTVNGVTTTYTYDEANQLKTSTVNGETTHYRYDAAGRLVQAGDKTYYYFGANDKVTEVRQGDKVIAEFDYFMDGQIASAKYPDREESFTWDGLALVQRNEVSYLNEPYVTGGNPILSSRDGVMFNDMLGSTLNIGGQPVSMTSFGETEDAAAFFTGKPMIPELGYSFLFRDYNPSQGKWNSSDPLGYPDGWNNLAYCKNNTIHSKDPFGLCQWVSDTGTIKNVPRSEVDPIGNAPVGFTFVPCHSTVETYTSTLVLYQYYSNTIFVPCKDSIHVFIPRWEGDSGDDFHYMYSFDCGKDYLEVHNGVQILEISMAVYLNPEIREYDCLRKEIIGYHNPKTTLSLGYTYSRNIKVTNLCE